MTSHLPQRGLLTLEVVVSPFRPTSRIEGREPHHHVEAARRWCSIRHPLQDLTHLLLDCPASEPLLCAIFGTTSSIFDHWFQTSGRGPTDGSPWSSSTPLSLGRGRVAPPPWLCVVAILVLCVVAILVLCVVAILVTLKPDVRYNFEITLLGVIEYYAHLQHILV